MKVTDPDGQSWRVSRRWVPWRRRRWSRDDLPAPDPSLDLGGGLEEAVFGLVLLVVLFLVLLVAPVVLLALLVAMEFLLLFVLLPFAVLGRVLFGRHWHVELRRGWTPWHEEAAGGWQASGLRIHDLAADVRRGTIPARTLGARAAA